MSLFVVLSLLFVRREGRKKGEEKDRNPLLPFVITAVFWSATAAIGWGEEREGGEKREGGDVNLHRGLPHFVSYASSSLLHSQRQSKALRKKKKEGKRGEKGRGSFFRFGCEYRSLSMVLTYIKSRRRTIQREGEGKREKKKGGGGEPSIGETSGLPASFSIITFPISSYKNPGISAEEGKEKEREKGRFTVIDSSEFVNAAVRFDVSAPRCSPKRKGKGGKKGGGGGGGKESRMLSSSSIGALLLWRLRSCERRTPERQPREDEKGKK